MPQSTFSVGPDDSISVRESSNHSYALHNYEKIDYAPSSVYSRNTHGETIAPPFPSIPFHHRPKPLTEDEAYSSTRTTSPLSTLGMAQNSSGLQNTHEPIEYLEAEHADSDSIISNDCTDVTEWPTHDKMPSGRTVGPKKIHIPISSVSKDALTLTHVIDANSGETEWKTSCISAVERDEDATESRCNSKDVGRAVIERTEKSHSSYSSSKDKQTESRGRSSNHANIGRDGKHSASVKRSKSHHPVTDKGIARHYRRSNSSKRDTENALVCLSRSHTHTGTRRHESHHHSTSTKHHKNALTLERGAKLGRSQSLPPKSNLHRPKRSKRKRSRMQRVADWLTRYMAGAPADSEFRGRPKYW